MSPVLHGCRADAKQHGVAADMRRLHTHTKPLKAHERDNLQRKLDKKQDAVAHKKKAAPEKKDAKKK